MPLHSLAAAWRRLSADAPDCAENRDDALQMPRESHATATRRFALCAARPDFSCVPPRILDPSPLNGQSPTPALDGAPPSALDVVGATAAHPCFSWSVLWDICDFTLVSYTGTQLVGAICAALAPLHPHGTAAAALLRHITAFADFDIIPPTLRAELQACGVQFIQVTKPKPREIQGKPLTLELALAALNHRLPHGICLIAAEIDYIYALSLLKGRGYTTAFFSTRKIPNWSSITARHHALSMGDVLKDLVPVRPAHLEAERRRSVPKPKPEKFDAGDDDKHEHDDENDDENDAENDAENNDEHEHTASSLMSRRLQAFYKELQSRRHVAPKKHKGKRKGKATKKQRVAIGLLCVAACIQGRRAWFYLSSSEATRVAWNALVNAVPAESALVHLVAFVALVACILNFRYLGRQ